MRLLTSVTLGYVAVLVAALAASLIAIWARLLRISRALREVREALAPTADDTRPLGEHLERLHEAVNGAANDLVTAGESIGRAERRRAAPDDQSGTGASSPPARD